MRLASVKVCSKGPVAFVQAALHDGWLPLLNIHEALKAEGYIFDDTPIDRNAKYEGLYFLNIYPKKK